MHTTFTIIVLGFLSATPSGHDSAPPRSENDDDDTAWTEESMKFFPLLFGPDKPVSRMAWRTLSAPELLSISQEVKQRTAKRTLTRDILRFHGRMPDEMLDLIKVSGGKARRESSEWHMGGWVTAK